MLIITPDVTSITGTANQVIASAPNGAVTLSTPQDIGTASSVTFGNVTDSAMTAQSILFAGTAGIIAQDTTQFLYDSTNHGLLFAGGTTATAVNNSNTVIRAITNNTSLVNQFEVYNSAKASSSPGFIFSRGRGTFASQSIAVSGDALGNFVYDALIGTNAFGEAVKLTAQADGTVSGSSSPGRFLIFTQPAGSTSDTAILEAVRWDSSQNQSNVGKLVKYNNVSTAGYGVPAIVDRQGLTAQAADIADTNFTNAGTVGEYRISYYILDTTSDITAGAVTLNIKFNDGTAARTISSAAVVLTATTAFAQSIIYARLGSGNVTYGTTHTGIFGTAQYAVYLICERVN